MKQNQMRALAGTVVLVVLILLALSLQPVGAGTAPNSTPTPQHVQLEPGGTVYILGDCHMTVDVNGAESLQVTCEAASK